jgi:hypothetical protein
MRSEAQMSDALVKKKTIGYPREYLFELDGIAPTEITRINKMIAAEEAAARDAAIREAADFEQFGGNSLSASDQAPTPGEQSVPAGGQAVAAG